MTIRTFYVDDKRGNDLNSGTSAAAPWKTLEKVNNFLFRPGDKICFKCDGKWRGTLSPKGDGAFGSPVQISSYGEGELPEIDGCGAYAAVWLKGNSHIVVEKLKVTNRAKEKAVRQGICVEGKAEGITEDITIQYCEVTEVCGQNCRAREVYESMYWNGGIYVTIPGRSSAQNHLHRVHIRNNYIHDVLTSGIRINQEEDFINDIHHTGIAVRGNRIERTGSDGIIVANSISPVISGNRCYDAGALGSREETQLIAGVWVCATSNALIERNEVARTRLFTGDGTAFDTDWGTEGTTVIQYNYTHDNEGGFWLDCSSFNYNCNYEKTVLRYNVSLRDGRGIIVEDRGLLVELYGNLFAYEKPAEICVNGKGENFVFRNNELFLPELQEDSWGAAAFDGNHYLGKVCPGDRNPLSKSALCPKELLLHAEDGIEWLEDKWELLTDLVVKGKTTIQ